MIFRRPGILTPARTLPAAARRELAEELGVTGEEPEFLFAHAQRISRRLPWKAVP